MRATTLLLGLLLTAALSSAGAAASETRLAFVVLDRGRDARETATLDAERALELVRVLADRGVEVVLLAATAAPDGAQKLTAPAATPAGLAALSTDEAFAQGGATDPRAALRTVLVGVTGQRALDVFLLGPFGAPDGGWSKGAVRALEKATSQWNETAAPDSRVLPLGLGAEARAVLEGVRGLAPSGWIVSSFGAAVARPQGFSPLAPAPPPLAAQVRVPARLLPVGEPGEAPVLLEAVTDVPEDAVTTRAADSLQLVDIERKAPNGRTATVSFRARPAPDVLWLCEPPAPLTFRWEVLLPDARLEALGEGAAVIFEAVGAEAGTPVVRAFRLRRTQSGRTPAWRATGAPLPEGLRWSVGEEVAASSDVVEAEVRVEFHAQRATPVDAQGVLVLEADGMPAPLRIPWVVRVDPGRIALRMQDAEVAWPRAGGDLPAPLRIEALDANAPARARLALGAPPDHAPWLRGVLHLPDGGTAAWAPGAPVDAPVEVTLGLALEAADDAPADLAWPVDVTIRLVPQDGVAGEGAGVVHVRRRRPRLLLAEPTPLLRVTGGQLAVVRPLLLRLDADGGDGAWLVDLLRQAPRVASGRASVGAWTVVSREPGTWEAVPEGAWSGRPPRVFDDARTTVPLTIDWPAGDVPAALEVPVEIPARWGARGWLFVALAGLALALGLAAFVLMRAPRIGGTLLYAIEDREGAVGRLDLGGVGRRRAVVTADRHGRLALGGVGEPLLRLDPTRVGGVVEVLGPGGWGERRLLVEGLALRVGQHRLRYLSGLPPPGPLALDETPDLLGPEYDLASGRIESLGPAGGDAPSDSDV